MANPTNSASVFRAGRTGVSLHTQSDKPRIAIIGAGPAGLTLGCLLHRRGISFTIYELRPRPTDADLTSQQSGVLDLHPETGLAAIDACELRADFDARTVECAEESIVAGKDGTVLWSAEGDGTRPEISRHALTKLLLSRLPGECVRWGWKLVSAEADEDGKGKGYNLTFSTPPSQSQGQPQEQESEREQTKEATTATTAIQTETIRIKADLLIGADGAWSRTRPLLTPTTPQYSGEQMIIATIPDLNTRYPALEAFVGKGSLIIAGDGNAAIGQRAAGGAVRFYFVISSQDDEDLAKTIGLDYLTRPSEVKELLLERGRDNPENISATNNEDENESLGGQDKKKKGKITTHWRNFNTWGSLPKSLISTAIDEHFLHPTADKLAKPIDMKPMYMLPVGKLAWPHRAGATLVGDAAHLMTPFAGEGVNLAMRDALDLASAIGTAWDVTYNHENHDDDDDNSNDSGHQHQHQQQQRQQEEQRSESSQEPERDIFLGTLDPLLQDFEKEMINRGEAAAEETWTNLQLFFGEDAARKVASIFQQL